MALKFRRGTTAQKSGSLAYGEPYVNTTLGTLQIGGETGDITLAGTSATVGISGSSLDITGNAKIDGNLTLGGNITIGDAGTDTIAINADLSSSLIPNNDNAFTIGTDSLRYSNIYGVNIIGSISANNGVVSGSSQVDVLSTTNIARLATTGSNIFVGDQTITGSLAINDSATNFHIEGNGFSQTYLTSNGAIVLNPGYGGVEMVGSYRTFKATDINVEGTLSASVITGIGNVTEFSTSVDSRLSNLQSTTASLSQRVAANEAVSGTFARTNSTNIFNGNQTITGSLYVTQDLVVQGSSSIQNVSSSTLNIGTNIITVAVNQPSVRFGGIAVVDSGSAGGSGSFLYDSVEDEFIFVHRGNGTNVTSSHFVLGPETYDNLGNETYLTNNRLSKGTGKEHLNDSNITDTGTLITLGSNTVVNGTLVASGTTLVSSSAQVIGILSSLNTYTGSNDTTNTTQTSRLDQLSTASGSAITRLTTLEVETANLEAFTSSINTTIKTRLNAEAVISGSSQVTLSSTTGYGSVLNQAVLTTSTPTFGNLTINGTITATGDITAFFTSDKRHKNNIQTISNAVLKVKQLNGVTWEWNDDVNEVTKSTPKTGLIAQEVQQVLPQVVIERENGFLALDYSKMVGLLVEAIKEQQIQIDQLKAQIGSK
jgi:hypothetical protein